MISIPIIECFPQQFSKQCIGPCKPAPCEFLGIILVERLVHEPGTGMRFLEHLDTLL